MFGKPVQSQVSALPQLLPSIVASNGGPAAVKNVATSVVSNENSQPIVLGETSSASLLTQKVITSPKTTSNYLYAVLMMIVSIALLLNVVIKPKIQHPRLILNGVALLVILNAALILNHYLAFANAAIF